MGRTYSFEPPTSLLGATAPLIAPAPVPTPLRDFKLEAIAKHFPQLLTFVNSTMEFKSDLKFGHFVLRSEKGVRHGDPTSYWIL